MAVVDPNERSSSEVDRKPSPLSETAGRPSSTSEALSRPSNIPREPPSSDTPPSGLETLHPAASPLPLLPPSTLDPLPSQFGRYQIIKRLGHGGMGQVYLAQDTKLDRPVALKVPHSALLSDSQILERFYREARAAAHVRHPHLCPIYDVGQMGAFHYLTMAYIEGQSLSERVKNHPHLFPQEIVALIRKVALALEEAHRHGIIHRDLKPSNIMIDRNGEPVVLDFGLVRPLGQEEARLTQTGHVLGTPAYMAPEQVTGDVNAIGPGCDVYSLGVVLYELLTGRIPYVGSSGMVMAQILMEDPRPPSFWRADLNPNLDRICLKAMAKRISDRYATMAEFAAALNELLEGWCKTTALDSPRPPSSDIKYVVENKARRGLPAPWWVLIAGGLALVIGLVLILPRFLSTDPQEKQGFGSRHDSESSQLADGKKEPRSVRDRRSESETKPEPEKTIHSQKELKLEEKPESKKQSDPAEVIAPRDEKPGELRKFVGHADVIWDVVFSPDGKRAATASGDRTIRLWDARTAQEIHRFRGHGSSVNCLAFSPNGETILSGSDDKTVRLWDLTNGNQSQRFDGHEGVITAVAFSPDGKQVLSSSGDKTARLWGLGTGKESKRFKGHTALIWCLAFSHDGRRFLSGGDDRTVRLWKTDSGEELARLDGHSDSVLAVAFSADGRQALSAGRDNTIRHWDLDSKQELSKVVVPSLSAVSFSADGHLVLVGGEDKIVRLLDADSGRELHRFEGHSDAISSVAFSGDGRQALSGSNDQTAKLWLLPSSQ